MVDERIVACIEEPVLNILIGVHAEPVSFQIAENHFGLRSQVVDFVLRTREPPAWCILRIPQTVDRRKE